MPHTVLVVDDEPALLRLMEFVLARQGFTLLTAVNGEEALEQVRRLRPDILVVDIMMPKMDGFQVVEALRADPQFASLPIVMLSAKAQDEDIERGMQIGVNAYVTKPFSPEELVAIVSEQINSAEENAAREQK